MGILVELFDVDYDIFIQAQVLLFGIFMYPLCFAAYCLRQGMTDLLRRS